MSFQADKRWNAGRERVVNNFLVFIVQTSSHRVESRAWDSFG